jgi:hypothetical protein
VFRGIGGGGYLPGFGLVVLLVVVLVVVLIRLFVLLIIVVELVVVDVFVEIVVKAIESHKTQEGVASPAGLAFPRGGGYVDQK